MSAEYDRERAAALLKEAQAITGHLKIEAEGLERQLASVLDGDDTPVGRGQSQNVAESAAAPNGPIAAKSGWSFWC